METVVARLLRDPEHMQRIADTAFYRMVEHSDPQRFARDIAEMLRSSLADASDTA